MKLVTFGTCLNDFFENEVHPCVAGGEVTVEGVAVFEFDEHGVAYCGV